MARGPQLPPRQWVLSNMPLHMLKTKTMTSSRRRALFLLLALASVLAIARPVPAHAAGMQIAVEDESSFFGPSYLQMAAVGHASELSTSYIRVNLIWAGVPGAAANSKRRPKVVRYSFAKIDNLVALAATQKIRLQLTLTGPAPAWASSAHHAGVVGPNATAYADFVRQVATHFKGSIERYSIWNEPNLTNWLQPSGGCKHFGPCIERIPGLYRALYTKAYSAIKRADPKAQVLIGETNPYLGLVGLAPLRFIRAVACRDDHYRVLRHCPGLTADGYAHHPYEFLHAPNYKYPGGDNATIGVLGRLTGTLDKLARLRALRSPSGRALDLYLTEFGYYHTGKRGQPVARRAAWEVQAFSIAAHNPRVKEMLQYLLFPLTPNPGGRGFDTSILDPGGMPNQEFRALQQWIAGALASGLVAAPGSG